ncbi:chalcone isomerase family protein [Nonlabens xiamenensis]|uniref:chalcone isomerase family protein n=1 Tax=Nonlabens xiamenensis TaxID=2341043 RepID=UPI000F60891A|nr:chalcone isomerase family protein [Nonlabens xiamenensis]
MKKILLLVVAIIGTFSFSSAQKTINGVTVEKNLTVAGQELSLNGAGMREKLWFDLYVGALYTTKKYSDGNMLVKADEAMAITLDITDSKVTQKRMKEAVEDGFEDSCTDSERAAIKSEINTFVGLFSEAIVEGDHFEIAYAPGKGTMISKNGKQLGTIAGMDFKKGLFGIWLGNDPADDDLKEGMLGQ